MRFLNRFQRRVLFSGGAVILLMGVGLLALYWPLVGETGEQIQERDHHVGDVVTLYGTVNNSTYAPWLHATVVEMREGGFRFSLSGNYTPEVDPGSRIFVRVTLGKGPTLGWSAHEEVNALADTDLIFAAIAIVGAVMALLALLGGGKPSKKKEKVELLDDEDVELPDDEDVELPDEGDEELQVEATNDVNEPAPESQEEN